MSTIWRKHLGSLRPDDEAAEAVLRSIKNGELVSVDVKRPRNPQHHKLFFALAGRVWENLDHKKYPTSEDVVTELKIITGHYTKTFIPIDGKQYTVLTPKSIKFSKLDQVGFAAFFDRCCDHIVANILPGITSESLREEIEIMTGIRVRP